MDEKKKSRNSNWPYLIIIAFLLIVAIIVPAYSTATLLDRDSGGFANTQYQTFVYGNTMPGGGSDDFTIPSTFDLDTAELFYTELHNWTLPLKIISNTGGVCVITGDATYDYLVICKDYDDF